MAKVKDITGKRFGMLTVIELDSRKLTATLWNCLCDCGNKKVVRKSNLVTGQTKSCGCLSAELASKRLKTHGNSTQKKPTKEYRTWIMIKSRCTYPGTNGYERYGGRGISVYDRWEKSFVDFLNDMGECPSPDHSIERTDVNGNYEPGNCCWATTEEQSRNKRIPKNNKTGTVGVTWHKPQNKWVSSIMVKGKRFHLGYHERVEEAIIARKEAELKYWGKSS